MSQGFMYILLCADGSYYTGSTNDLARRIAQHEVGEGANHTRKHGPVKLVYYEWFPRVDQAFYREKQVQGWSRKKKEALINGEFDQLPELAKAYRDIKALQALASSASANAITDLPKPEVLEGEAPAGPEVLEAPDNETPTA